MMAARKLPASLPPRGLTVEDAAAYCGISRNSLLRHGPPPTEIGGRNVWNRRALDLWLDHLAGLTPEPDAESQLLKAIHGRKDPLRHPAPQRRR